MPEQKPYGEMTLDELIKTMRGTAANMMQYQEMSAELDRRQSIAVIGAADAQKLSAYLQVAAVIAMYLTILATLFAPWVAKQF